MRFGALTAVLVKIRGSLDAVPCILAVLIVAPS
jgi:hypothetical protein